MRLTHWCPFFLVAVLFVGMPQVAVAQSGGYTVTATLDPFFIHPNTGEDLTLGIPLKVLDGLIRGADGWLYGIMSQLRNHEDTFAIIRVSPTRGTAQVLYVMRSYYGRQSSLLVGRNGRLYFTTPDVASPTYIAPGYEGTDADCVNGCVLYIDTASHGVLRNLHVFGTDDEALEGIYPRYYSILEEDIDGNIYTETTRGNRCIDGSEPDEGALVKISYAGDATVLQGYGCDDPEFDWSTVILSNNYRPWSDGRVYRAEYSAGVSQIFQYDDYPSDSKTLLATIAPGDGIAFGLAEGGGYIYGLTRSGGELNGGVVFRIRVPSLASPDLVVTAMSNPPLAAAPGELFTVTDTTENSGSEPAGESFSRYYLSADGTHADVRLTNGRYLPELWPGEESTGARNVRIPTTTPTGVYWLVVCADTALKVPEADDDNNCLAAESQITVGRPDLRQVSVTNAAAFASPGGKIGVTDTVDNPTIVTAPASSTRFYLSLDLAKNAGDVLLTSKRAVEELSPGEVSTGPATLALPVSVPDGSYYVLVCADDLAKIKEANEANNCAASSTTLRVGWADLVTTTVSDPPATAIRGQKFAVSDTVRNQGTIPAVASATRYYVSVDSVKNAGDVLLMGARAVASLDPSVSSPGGRLVTVPLTTPLGTYRVLACADDTGKVPEQDNANNCLASAATVTIQ